MCSLHNENHMEMHIMLSGRKKWEILGHFLSDVLGVRCAKLESLKRIQPWGFHWTLSRQSLCSQSQRSCFRGSVAWTKPWRDLEGAWVLV